MSLTINTNDAEQRYRDAFSRLKTLSTTILPKGSPITQNNVAREAGCDPSSLKKSRYPQLIQEIQAYAHVKSPSISAEPNINTETIQTLKDEIRRLTTERDMALSKQVESDLLILDLSREVEMLQSKIAKHTVSFKK